MKTIPSVICFSFYLCVCFPSRAQVQQGNPAFNHIYLGVHNMDSSLKFYTTAFDLKITNRISQLDITQADTAFKRPVNIVFLKFPGQDLVYELGERSDTTKTGNLFQHVGVEVKDLKGALQRILDAGGKLAVPIRQVKTNSGLAIKQAVVKGLDGESIEIVEVISGAY